MFDSDSDLVGIITASDIIKAFRTTDINPALEDVMTRKVGKWKFLMMMYMKKYAEQLGKYRKIAVNIMIESFKRLIFESSIEEVLESLFAGEM